MAAKRKKNENNLKKLLINLINDVIKINEYIIKKTKEKLKEIEKD